MGLDTLRRAMEGFRVARTPPESWSVVATVREPLMLVKAFVAQHLSLGAERIHLFFDDPLDTAADVLEGTDRVSVVRCDRGHWQGLGGKRPSDHRVRQIRNANWVYKQCNSTWLCHIDADEFLVSKHEIGRALAFYGSGSAAVRVWPAERVYLGQYDDEKIEFDGYFKLPALRKARIGKRLFGSIGSAFGNGFQGHSVGKLFTRTGQPDVRLKLHSVEEKGHKVKGRSLEGDEILLAHCFPLDFTYWKNNYDRKINNRKYYGSLDKLSRDRLDIYEEAAKEGDAGLMRLFRQLTVLEARQEMMLRDQKLLSRIDLDLTSKLAVAFPPKEATCNDLPSVLPAKSTCDNMPKVFQIGMSNCGTKDLCRQFARRGLGYAHFNDGKLAKAIDEKRLAELAEFDRVQLFANLVHGGISFEPHPTIQRIQLLAAAFPDAIFVLNRREVQDWAASLVEKIQDAPRSGLMDRLQAASLTELESKLVADWNDYREQVSALLGSGMRLVEYKLENAKPGYVFEQLEKHRDPSC